MNVYLLLWVASFLGFKQRALGYGQSLNFDILGWTKLVTYAYKKMNCRVYKCNSKIRSLVENAISGMVWSGPENITKTLGNVYRSIGEIHRPLLKGSAAIYTGLLRSLFKFESIPIMKPGDADIVIRNFDGPGELELIAERVAVGLEKFLSVERIKDILKNYNFVVDEKRDYMCGKKIRNRNDQFLISWLSPVVIHNSYTNEDVWLTRVALPVYYKYTREIALIYLVDIVGMKKENFDYVSIRRENGYDDLNGFEKKTLDCCIGEHLRMVFDEPGHLPWNDDSEDKYQSSKTLKRTKRLVVMCIAEYTSQMNRIKYPVYSAMIQLIYQNLLRTVEDAKAYARFDVLELQISREFVETCTSPRLKEFLNEVFNALEDFLRNGGFDVQESAISLIEFLNAVLDAFEEVRDCLERGDFAR